VCVFCGTAGDWLHGCCVRVVGSKWCVPRRSLGSVAGTVFEYEYEYRPPGRTEYEYEESQSDMSRDREGAVGRALRAVQAVGLTRSREAAKPRRKAQGAVFGFRFSVFGQASRGRESAGVRFDALWAAGGIPAAYPGNAAASAAESFGVGAVSGCVPPHPRPLSPVSRGRGEDFVFLVHCLEAFRFVPGSWFLVPRAAVLSHGVVLRVPRDSEADRLFHAASVCSKRHGV
jgi:hypothetical protein